MKNDDKIIVVDKKIDKVYLEYINRMGYRYILNKGIDSLYEEISSHTDICFCKIGDTVIAEKTIYNNLEENIKKKYNIVEGSTILQSTYPYDIAYNVFTTSNIAIHNFKYTDSHVLDLLQKNGYTKININQGYTNCSISYIDEETIVTSDKIIADKLVKLHFEVLYIPNECIDIKLINKKDKYIEERNKEDKNKKDNKNYEYSKMSGFIGGATTRIDDKYIVFGDIRNIGKEYADKLVNMLKKRNIELIDFKGQDIVDYGGVIQIEKRK